MIDFPASPTDGQLFSAPNGVVYKWSATYSSWLAQAGPSVVTWRQIARVVPTAGQATVDFTGLPSDINDLMFSFDITPTLNSVDLIMNVYDNTGVLDNTSGHYNFTVTQSPAQSTGGSAPAVYGSTAIGTLTGILWTNGIATRRVGNTSGIRGRGTIPNIRDARVKGMDGQANWVSDDGTITEFATVGGYRTPAGLITGLQFRFIGTTFAAGGAITLWGSQ